MVSKGYFFLDFYSLSKVVALENIAVLLFQEIWKYKIDHWFWWHNNLLLILVINTAYLSVRRKNILTKKINFLTTFNKVSFQ